MKKSPTSRPPLPVPTNRLLDPSQGSRGLRAISPAEFTAIVNAVAQICRQQDLQIRGNAVSRPRKAV